MNVHSDGRHAGFATAVIVAAGRGERFGAAAKVLAVVGGRPMLAWTLDAVELAPSVREVVVVSGDHTDTVIRELIDTGPWCKPIRITEGGLKRHDSVMAGVRAASDDIDLVLIHDAARPLVTADLFESCARAARTLGAAIVAVPVSDTIKRVIDGEVVETIPRDELWSAQTPQGFRRELLLDAGERAARIDVDCTDEASLLELFGYTVKVVIGAPSNLKVTHADDLHVADALLRRRAEGAVESKSDDP